MNFERDPNNKKIFVIINGKPRSGKDSFVEFCSMYKKVYNYSSIEPIKEIASTYFGYNDNEKTDKSRKFLSDLKRITNDYCDYSFKKLITNMTLFYFKMDRDIMFIHCREPKEIKKIKKEYPSAITLLISRPETDNLEYSNSSDMKVNKYNYDYIIANNGSLEDLKATARAFTDLVYNYKTNKESIVIAAKIKEN